MTASPPSTRYVAESPTELANRPPVLIHRPDAPPSDGRAARSYRTIEKIIQAMLELVERDGALRPTADQVANRAGVSRRAVYLHFESLEALFAAAVERRTSELFSEWQPPPRTSPLETRVEWFSRSWSELIECLLPLCRAAALHAPLSSKVTTTSERVHAWMRAAAEAAFQSELAACRDEDRCALANALHYLTSCTTWTDMRMQGTDIDEATGAMHQLLSALLLADR